MKKMISLFAAIVLAATLLFAGCSTHDSDSGGETTSMQNTESAYTQQDEQQSGTTSSQSQGISQEEAVQIVLSRVEGADESNIHEIKADQDDGQFVYEGELLYNGYEYEFEIDGTTGEIIKWEIDRD